MKKILTLVLLAGVLTTTGFAEGITVDATAGAYINSTASSFSLETFRETAVAVELPVLPVGLKLNNKAYNGLGFTGALDNYRIELLAFKKFNVSGFTLIPCAGASYAASSIADGAISLDVGGEVRLDTPLAPLRVGGIVLFYSDSKQLEYYAGFKIGLMPAVNMLLLYEGFYGAGTHMIGGGVKVEVAL
ncbi:MAG: hypothetical protein A2452_05100 [Candidatus Firestonebacteria bacterium RIFOXYC2_FULL_39_67]|nr:MAG: hypothetical protein A2536_10665 [Candidatus Firestonebacteria bacterium RIFOXYD2_FULL_39_29]OGF54421.1 MAG: hypothetical protein A2497_05715 [Candidatus Firestonebacteria bacterium RifOxyC12_full_39_7]OGF54502.1 MAG: hypothetical protein A2452_05100 [Candidatus Firestonebacteria bacterium RIFOXYC2_FULL_39_67]